MASERAAQAGPAAPRDPRPPARGWHPVLWLHGSQGRKRKTAAHWSGYFKAVGMTVLWKFSILLSAQIHWKLENTKYFSAFSLLRGPKLRPPAALAPLPLTLGKEPVTSWHPGLTRLSFGDSQTQTAAAGKKKKRKRKIRFGRCSKHSGTAGSVTAACGHTHTHTRTCSWWWQRETLLLLLAGSRRQRPRPAPVTLQTPGRGSSNPQTPCPQIRRATGADKTLTALYQKRSAWNGVTLGTATEEKEKRFWSRLPQKESTWDFHL